MQEHECTEHGAYGRNGQGIAVSDALGVLVVSHELNALSIFRLPRAYDVGCNRGFKLLRTLSGAAMKTLSTDTITFMDPDMGQEPKLLVADYEKRAVHVVDIMCDGGAHLGFVARPREVRTPRAISSAAHLAAVTCWRGEASDFWHVKLYERDTTKTMSWVLLRVLDDTPGGLGKLSSSEVGFILSKDATEIVFANSSSLKSYGLSDGAVVRHRPHLIGDPVDVKRLDGGYAILCNSTRAKIAFANVDSEGKRAYLYSDDVSFAKTRFYSGFDVVPGVGYVVRDLLGSRIWVLTSGVLRMSAFRVAWMLAVCRGIMLAQRIYRNK